MTEKTQKSFRCKSSTGYSCQWRVGRTSIGDYKVLSCGKIKVNGNPIPSDFAPFEIMDAVLNRSIRFKTLEAAEDYVKGL